MKEIIPFFTFSFSFVSTSHFYKFNSVGFSDHSFIYISPKSTVKTVWGVQRHKIGYLVSNSYLILRTYLTSTWRIIWLSEKDEWPIKTFLWMMIPRDLLCILLIFPVSSVSSWMSFCMVEVWFWILWKIKMQFYCSNCIKGRTMWGWEGQENTTLCNHNAGEIFGFIIGYKIDFLI